MFTYNEQRVRDEIRKVGEQRWLAYLDDDDDRVAVLDKRLDGLTGKLVAKGSATAAEADALLRESAHTS